MSTNRAVFVTGSAGFIGFHLAKSLLESGRTVFGLDNFNAYYDVQLKEDRHAELERYPGFTGIRGDLCDYRLLEQAIAADRVDTVVHLAAQAGVRYSLDHPFAYLKSNLDGFLTMLEVVRHAGLKKFIYASSSSVYGGNTKLPFAEHDPVDTPVSLYAATKRADELIAHTYTHLYGIQTIGLRFFTVYGPWGRPDMALWIFTQKIRDGIPIPVYNYGKMQRDFTFVDDIVNGILATLDSDRMDAYEIFNLGNNRSEQLLDLIAEIETALGRTAELELLPIQPGDVPATYADIDKAQEKLGYHPATTISEGVPCFVNWFQNYAARRHRQRTS